MVQTAQTALTDDVVGNTVEQGSSSTSTTTANTVEQGSSSTTTTTANTVEQGSTTTTTANTVEQGTTTTTTSTAKQNGAKDEDEDEDEDEGYRVSNADGEVEGGMHGQDASAGISSDEGRLHGRVVVYKGHAGVAKLIKQHMPPAAQSPQAASNTPHDNASNPNPSNARTPVIQQ